MPTKTPRDRSLTVALAAEIRAERSALQLTQADVFTAAGVPSATYKRLESGQRDIDVAQLVAVAEALRVSASELVRRAEVRRDSES